LWQRHPRRPADDKSDCAIDDRRAHADIVAVVSCAASFEMRQHPPKGIWTYMWTADSQRLERLEYLGTGREALRRADPPATLGRIHLPKGASHSWEVA